MTKPFFSKNQITSKQIWELAVQWVDANKKLVGQIAAPYLRYMAADTSDLFQEATISAFKAMNIVLQKERTQQFIRFFRVIFKSNCLKLASGIQTVQCEMHYAAIPVYEREPVITEDHKALDRAFKVMTKRQQQICYWILNQPFPVSTPELAREFKISRRHACRLVSCSIARIAEVQR